SPHSEPTASFRLTQERALIGSPRYMAPELWTDARLASPATDLYALGVMTYECLRGRPPFEPATLEELRRSHADAPVPPLGDGFPPELDEVLARAMAKRASKRPATALEYAALVRAASGVKETAVVPQLDPSLREYFFANAPQPIAEALALLESAHTSY